MLKVIKIGEKEIPFKFTLNAAIIYRNEFNKDLFADLAEIDTAANETISKAVSAAKINLEKYKEFATDEKKLYKAIEKDFSKNIDYAELLKPAKFTTEQYINGRNIIYCFAKNADESIKTVDKFLELVDVLPIPELCSVLFKLWHESCKTTIEIKN